MSTHHLAGLNAEQAAAVRRVEGPLLVLAGAGTGKTRVVTCRIAEILQRGARPAEICAVTFTNKAAREMRERVRDLLRGTDVDGMVVSTFHSLGLRILREYGERLGLGGARVADTSDQEAVFRDALREAGVGRNELDPRQARFVVSLWKNQGLRPDDALEAAAGDSETRLAIAYGRYQEDLRRRRLLDFDDLILLPLELFEKHPDALAHLQRRWRYFLVDEYQDTNGCQYRLIRHLAAQHENLCVVGDDDQSIYAWRGAEPKHMLAFPRDFEGAELVTLSKNYRSTAQILAAANTLISGNTSRFPKTLEATSGSGAPIHLYLAEDEKDELDFLVSRILRFREEEKMRWESCAVLFRANSQCRPLEQALRARQIPYRVVGTRSFFDRREVRDLLAYLRIAHDPNDDAALLRIINTPARGIGKGSIDRLSEWAADERHPLLPTLEARLEDLPARPREGARELLGTLAVIRDVAREAGPARALEQLIERTLYRAHLKQIADDPLDLTRREGAIDELVRAAAEHEVGRSGADLQSLLDNLALATDESERDEDDKGAGVTLLTMHAAKGLEYPVVFVVGVEEGIVPHARSVDEEEDPSGRGLEEERRLFYVAITRARKLLFLSMARKRTRFGKEVERDQSRFVDEIGTDAMKVVDTADQTPASEESSKAWMQRIRGRLEAAGGGG